MTMLSSELKAGWILGGKLASLWKSTVSGSLIASIIGFAWSESNVGDPSYAFRVAAVSGGIGAVCATIPRLILALKESRESKSRIHQTEINNLITRIHEVNAEQNSLQKESHRAEVGTLRQAVEWAQNQAALTRISKHAALSECFRLTMRTVVLEAALMKHDIAIPVEAKPLRSLDEILGEEDDKMRQMVDARLPMDIVPLAI